MRALLVIAALSWALLLASVAFFIWSGVEADDAIRQGTADAAKAGCLENNERWQIVVGLSNRQRPNRKRTEAEKKVVRQLTGRNCDKVRERFLRSTAP